jgi:hypothetical protein
LQLLTQEFIRAGGVAVAGDRFRVAINTAADLTSRRFLRDLAARVDVIVTSRSRAVQIRRLNLDVPMIELAFHISWESARRVVDALYSTPDAGQPDGRGLVASSG